MSSHDNGDHVLPLKLYMTVGIALFILTAVTVLVASFDFGRMNLVVAMIIAVVKGTLVCLFFMHLKYDHKLYATVMIFSLVFLGIFITITMYDTLKRGAVRPVYQELIEPKAKIYFEGPFRKSEAETVADTTAVKKE